MLLLSTIVVLSASLVLASPINSDNNKWTPTTTLTPIDKPAEQPFVITFYTDSDCKVDSECKSSQAQDLACQTDGYSDVTKDEESGGGDDDDDAVNAQATKGQAASYCLTGRFKSYYIPEQGTDFSEKLLYLVSHAHHNIRCILAE
jgi:hypothetical protein